MASPADDALLADLAAGREEAFERLYDLFGARLLRAARCICASREEAEDAVQDVFLALVRAGPALKEVRNLNAYLFSAAHRAAVRRAAGRRHERSIEGRANGRAAPEQSRNLANCGTPPPDRLNRALEALPAEQREVLALKVDGELTFEEIGGLLNVSPNTAASRYRYALEKLRDALRPGTSNTEETGHGG